MSDDSGEKTFAPSAKRKTDAAQKGDVLRSRDLSVAAVMVVGALWLKFAGPWLLGIFEDGAARRSGLGPGRHRRVRAGATAGLAGDPGLAAGAGAGRGGAGRQPDLAAKL